MKLIDRRFALRVLLLENDEVLAVCLAKQIRRSGHELHNVTSVEDALRRLPGFDLVILDLDTTDVDGLEACRRIRAVSDIPLITTTGHHSELIRALALRQGADDCLDKPYGFRELMVRMAAVMRRFRLQPHVDGNLSFGPLRIDPDMRRVTLDDRVVELTQKEFGLLHLLASRPGVVVSRQELMTKVWGDTWNSTGRTIDTHVSSLRGKLGDGCWIVTVRGVGFRFVAEPTVMPEAAAVVVGSSSRRRS
ncbi:response regulator transcription factor [Streptomyces sp. WI04-05B]|uniref:response regulator transcription factor n=1 Tax=Streptomyces sp. WI04-05A TaxID=3028707 RepID=UPI0029A88781|nr:response regulator transcription factor [Streptomyces sp. WI04-05A]MDX2546554.1 response regulator transcription factor [Streptomyces sp. WI04-05B]